MVTETIVFSEHARERFAQRAGTPLIVEDILAGGRVQIAAPGTPRRRDPADAWLVYHDVAFPLRRSGTSLFAVTCVRWRPFIPKADRRLMRELAREERAAA